jgi:predicted component of type VI protein secretion system
VTLAPCPGDIAMKKLFAITAVAALSIAITGCPREKREVKIETPEKKVEIEIETTDKR